VTPPPTPRRLDGDDARSALESLSLAPPSAPSSIGSGPLAELRNAMARFSHGAEHAAARRLVESAIDRIDVDDLVRAVENRMAGRSRSERERTVPAEALALQLGADAKDLPVIVDEVEHVVRVIGRGEPTVEQAEAACSSLLNRFADHPDGAIAAVSLLYQVFDATAALFRVTSAQLERQSGERPSALERTVRVATEPVKIGNHTLAAGEEVDVSIASLDLEFGAGVHACPGRGLANAVVDTLTQD